VETLTEVNQALHDEYALRRRMLTERVRVTLQSFLWSGRLKEQVCCQELFWVREVSGC